MLQQKLLKIEDLSEHLGVCRATVFELKAKGVLRAGTEYVKIGTRLRFLWPAVLERLIELTPSTGTGKKDTQTQEEVRPTSVPSERLLARPRGPRRTAANLSY